MNIQYLQIERPYIFSSPFKKAPFAALIYIDDDHISDGEQNNLSDQIVASGCRYAVCAGHNSSSWDDSIDMADIKRNNGEVIDDNLVMTTWHENEPLEDIVFHFLKNTSFGNFVADRLLVLVVGNNESVLDNIRNEIKKQLSSD
jgi:hypothetical protein